MALRISILTLVMAVRAGSAAAGAESGGGDFAMGAGRILGTHCVRCHNRQEHKGDLSLEHAEEALGSGVIEPGRPAQSSLLDAVVAAGNDPPAMPKDGAALTDADVQALREWIAAGADWPRDYVVSEPRIDNFDWWSFRPLIKGQVPRPDAGPENAGWARGPIDSFILDELRRQGLFPSAEADRRTLIRRLSFDLIGLPPTPAEIDRFVGDPDPAAYESLVERLLSSPEYGARWGRHWLDVVKYADTCGYDKDKLRPQAWPYRDYVIRAFNEDRPYGEFVRQQLAGDLLTPRSPENILGLGFLAAGPWDFIGHVEVPESKIDGLVARHTDRDEMVSNTMNTFCSVTIQCCQCHHHKFDPFTQQDYYNLQAVFAAVDRADRPFDQDPEVDAERARSRAQLAEAEQQLQSLEAEIAADSKPDVANLEQRISELQPRAEPRDKRPEYGYHSVLEAQPTTEKWVEVDLGHECELAGVVLHACHDEFAGIGAGFGFPTRYAVCVSSEPLPDSPESSGSVVFQAELPDGFRPSLAAIEIRLMKVRGRYVRIVARRLAERQHDFNFALAELEVLDGDRRNVARGCLVSALDSIEAPVRWGRANLTDGIWPRAAEESAAAELDGLLRQRRDALDRARTPERVAEHQRLEQRISALRQTIDQLPPGRMVYAAATQFEAQGNFQPTHGHPRPVHVLHRGNVQQPLDLAEPGTIPVITGAMTRFETSSDGLEGDRREQLANWIVRDDNPLTWRSIANRVWQHHFGRGLVDSPNDFGRMGKTPTHPALLDWLAADFRDGGMSIKRLQRLIVTSAAYRQVSTSDELRAAIDGDNRYLWRMNRRRLEAEEIRDAVLQVSGRLNQTMEGPGYYLFVLERAEHSPHYEYDKFDADIASSHRRSVYRFVVRSQPDPYMTTLDCADSSQSTPQRNETLTALQALSLLNNNFSLVMARHFGERMASWPGPTRSRADFGFRCATGRRPTAEELDDLTRLADEHGLPVLARVLFNLSEFVFVD